ncbi:exonuclease domain-containing protein [Mycetocola zhadangensis]|uniref:exonuclease domain-containing protein n=1 Tax=Mycetocola zhadangensis TaxID=1164595 RepID=UPI003A4D9CD2
MVNQGYAVIDFETTGFSPSHHHRVIEVAVVHVDPYGTVEGRWETVINPMRDLGPTHIHRLRGADVMHAPHFKDIAPAFVGLLTDRVVVAHNAAFEARFLRAELNRLGADSPVTDDGALCTMRLAKDFLPGSGRSLSDCCSAYDIDLSNAHEALADTEATEQLLAAYLQQDAKHPLWEHHRRIADGHQWPSLLGEGRPWVSRRRSEPAPASFLHQTMALLPDPEGEELGDDTRNYFAQLDEVLSDGFLSVGEADALRDVAAELGIGERKRLRLHRQYFDSLVAVAWADGVLTEAERRDISQVGTLLDIDVDVLSAALVRTMELPPLIEAASTGEADEPGPVLGEGDLVVLTGEMLRPREYYEDLLRAQGLVPWAAVTKKVKLVVAGDVDSMSGKARKARQYGISIIDENQLVAALNTVMA